MQGRRVRIDTGWQTVAAVQDLLEVKLGSSQAGYLTGFKVMQSSLEGITAIPKHKITLKRAYGTYSSGSGGGSATVIKGLVADAAHGLTTVERNNTTQASVGTGTIEDIDSDTLNEATGVLEIQYTPENFQPVAPSEVVILSLEEAPSSCTLRAYIDLWITHG